MFFGNFQKLHVRKVEISSKIPKNPWKTENFPADIGGPADNGVYFPKFFLGAWIFLLYPLAYLRYNEILSIYNNFFHLFEKMYQPYFHNICNLNVQNKIIWNNNYWMKILDTIKIFFSFVWYSKHRICENSLAQSVPYQVPIESGVEQSLLVYFRYLFLVFFKS